MTKENAKQIVIKEIGEERKISLLSDTEGAYVFMCESPDPEITPSKVAVAVNKTTGKTGLSILSIEEAIEHCS